MPTYKAPLENMYFAIDEVLDATRISQMPGNEEFSMDLVKQILEEGAKVCEEVLFPINQSGDEEGCHWENGNVTTPKGFKEAFQTYTEGGWMGLACDPEYGGMGMPSVLSMAMSEMVSASNTAFGMYPGLTIGAYEAIHAFGTAEQKQMYLPKMVSGEWTGTMNLTEPHCGSDLGLLRTKAADHDASDDSWKISGQKIFISAGEHDMSQNIIHLVLARLPDAPEGVKGISLFVVPKFLVNADGTPGERNSLECASIEHKMGIRSNATAVMVYENAKGWLVGEPHKGLMAMFTMMNAARLGVGMQGLGVAEVAYQNAREYAKERLQMRSLTGPKYPEKPADPIIVHPDVRRMLMISKAFTEGARTMSYWVALQADLVKGHPDPEVKQTANDFIDLLTPVVKAYQTDMGSEVAALGVQVHGGIGFICETGVEQYMRDAKIFEIYEGTNGIQALDLVGRKLMQNQGRGMKRFFALLQKFAVTNQANPKMEEFIAPVTKALGKLQNSMEFMMGAAMKNPEEVGAASTDFLRQFALVVMGYMWGLNAKAALKGLESGKGNPKFYEEKLKTARFFMARMLPEAEARHKMVLAGAASIMDMDEDQF
ncbi:MAG: acyl-CoA dehydrogenase C-terminal domain-containing protein [Methyloligellaceae bacterium]